MPTFSSRLMLGGVGAGFLPCCYFGGVGGNTDGEDREDGDDGEPNAVAGRPDERTEQWRSERPGDVWAVFWAPRDRPAQADPASSAAAVKPSPLSATVTTAPSPSAATTSTEPVASPAPTASMVAAAARATRRMGPSLLPARSDHRPVAIRPAAPAIWKANRSTPAVLAAQWRWETRYSREKVEMAIWGTTSRVLAPCRRHRSPPEGGESHPEGLGCLTETHGRASLLGGEPAEDDLAARRVDRPSCRAGHPEKDRTADQVAAHRGAGHRDASQGEAEGHHVALPETVGGGTPGDQRAHQSQGRGGHHRAGSGQGQVLAAAQRRHEHRGAVEEHGGGRLGGQAHTQDEPMVHTVVARGRCVRIGNLSVAGVLVAASVGRGRQVVFAVSHRATHRATAMRFGRAAPVAPAGAPALSMLVGADDSGLFDHVIGYECQQPVTVEARLKV